MTLGQRDALPEFSKTDNTFDDNMTHTASGIENMMFTATPKIKNWLHMGKTAEASVN